MGLPPIECIAMTRFLMYTNKINNMEDQEIPKISLNSSQGHLLLKRGWYKDAMAWLNHWRIDENTTLQNINNFKKPITSKFKARMWDEKDLEVKRKLRYYKEVINPNMQYRKYLFVLTSSNKKINIDKIRTNSHEILSDTRR